MAIRTVQLVLHPDQEGWILHKIAQRIKTELEILNLQVSIVGNPEGEADVYFWLYFGHSGITKHAKDTSRAGIRSAFVTHVDDAKKTNKIAKLINNNVDLVFMSKEHSETVANGLGQDKFFNILLGSDMSNYQEPFRIGIFSKRFSDGRKNEKWLIRLAQEMSLNDVEFIFVGSGWKGISLELRSLGVQTTRFDDDEKSYPEYSEFPEIYRSLDLFLSPSFDEGSMGSLDAYILGIEMLISRHGFHLELNLNEENYIDSYDDLKLKITDRLDVFRLRRAQAQEWSWGRTSLALLNHWESIEINPKPERKVSENFVMSNLDWSVKRKYLIRTFYRIIKINVFERIIKRITRNYFR